MGQLEKYGLYVLCLVIFLILGVTIWGGGDAPPSRRQPTTTGLNASVPPVDRATPATGSATPNLADLLQAAPRPAVTTPRSGEARPASADAGATGAPGTLNVGGGNEPKNPPAGPQPQATPAPETPPVAAATSYKVKAGDSFDSIARTVLGDAALRSEIARLNPGVRPERLQIGQALVLPTKGAASPSPSPVPAVAPAAPASPVVAYTIARGDTLEGIARRQLGDRKRVKELRELNPDVDPAKLRVGQKIRVPKQ
ncbi:MAG: LysM peptidoglycan-binding domain-containing protein [Planctomycetes bacterium]|nr:LysM peptidoglycan-binding domain-containing protein [Planctomycetota bacterium]